MNDLIKMQPPAESASWLAEFHAMTTEQIKAALAESLGLSAKNLLRCACLVHVLEDRGEDLSTLKVGIIHWLRKIACGQLLPEVVAQFAGKATLIDRLACLPLNDQRRFAAGEHVAVVVPADGGGRTVRMMDPLAMTRQQIAQAFGRDHVRSEAEQHAQLDGRREQARRPVPTKIGCMEIDSECGAVRVGRKTITLDDLKKAVRALES